MGKLWGRVADGAGGTAYGIGVLSRGSVVGVFLLCPAFFGVVWEELLDDFDFEEGGEVFYPFGG